MKYRILFILTVTLSFLNLSNCRKEKIIIDSGFFNVKGWKVDSTDFPYGWVSPTDVDFLNPETGYIIGTNGYLVKTTDGGRSWVKTQIEKDSMGVMTTSVSFVNDTTGYVYGYYNVLNGSWYGVLYKTTDGAKSWTKQYYSTVYHIHSMKFFDASNGMGLNYTNSGSYILTTNNGGISWHTNSIELNSSVYMLFFLGDICYTISKDLNLLKSTDHGITWQKIYTPVLSSKFILGFYFKNEDTGYLDLLEKQYKTSNGGSTWTEIKFPFNFDTPSAPYENLHLCNSDDGIFLTIVTDYIGGDFPSFIGTYAFTTDDGGNTWIRSDLMKQFYPGIIVYVSDNVAYVINNKYFYKLRKSNK